MINNTVDGYLDLFIFLNRCTMSEVLNFRKPLSDYPNLLLKLARGYCLHDEATPQQLLDGIFAQVARSVKRSRLQFASLFFRSISVITTATGN